MEQALTDANNEIHAVFAANDSLAQQAINAIEAAGIDVTTVPISGQDATQQRDPEHRARQADDDRLQAIQEEADLAAKAALALCAGDDPTEIESDFEFDTIGINISDSRRSTRPRVTGRAYLANRPVSVTVDNIADTVIADGFRTIEEICTGDTASTEFCEENSDRGAERGCLRASPLRR